MLTLYTRDVSIDLHHALSLSCLAGVLTGHLASKAEYHGVQKACIFVANLDTGCMLLDHGQVKPPADSAQSKRMLQACCDVAPSGKSV